MNRIYFLILALAASSCASVFFPSMTNYKGKFNVTTWDDKDTVCIQELVSMQWQSVMFKQRIPFTYISSKDSISLILSPSIGSTFVAQTQTHAYQVTFSSATEQRLGYIVRIEEGKLIRKGKRMSVPSHPDRRMVISLQCFKP
jgi:hypothetical protein